MSNPSFAIKGRCPGALQPMASGDGLIVRVRPPLGRLSAAQALRVAELAQQYGSGVLELSTRANVQLRGVAPAQHPALLQALAAQGLLDTDARSESLRCIVLDPFWQPGDGLQAGALALQQAVLGASGLDGLPPKFGWAVGQTQGISARIERQAGAADRDGLQGANHSHSRSYGEDLQRRRPPEAAPAHP